MATANLTVRVDESVKREFDSFCENVGLNATSAVNMFIKTVVRTRTLPFIVTDNDAAYQSDRILMAQMRSAVKSMQEHSTSIGNADMNTEEIDAIISNHR